MTFIQPVNAGRFLRLCRRTLRKASGFPTCCFLRTCGEAEPRRRFEKNSEPESRRLSAVCGGIAAKYRSMVRSLELAKLT